MPTYQYRCTECGHDLEAVQKFTDAALTECPNCGGPLRKIYNAVGVVFKGSGFYRTDSRKPEGSGEGKTESKSDGKSETKDGGSGSGSSTEKSAPKTDNTPAKTSSSAPAASSSSTSSTSSTGARAAS